MRAAKSVRFPRGRIACGLCALVAVCCYRPNIRDGGFGCNPDPAAGHPCPEGFTCDDDRNNPRCWSGPRDASVADDGMAISDGPNADAVEASPETGPSCFDARPSCDPSDAGACDPFCQTGCPGCHDKCAVSAPDGGVPTYSCVGVPSTPARLLEPCDVLRDNCGPGLVCLNDNCSGRCYAYCRSDVDCSGAACTSNGPGGVSVCDVPFVDGCNPLGGGAPAKCPTTSQGCFLSATHPTRTICDCSGGLREGAPCTNSRNCFQGLLCADPTGSGTSICYRVCKLGDDSTCAPGKTCTRYFGKDANNTPNATYGFCN